MMVIGKMMTHHLQKILMVIELDISNGNTDGRGPSANLMLDVALLGCGRWGINHLRVLSELRELKLIRNITVVDPSKDARNSAILANKTTKSLEGVEADLVIIATPSHLHADQARNAMADGYHVLVEKPLGCCEAEAAQVLATAIEHGRIIGVGLLLRFHPAIKLVKKLLTSGKIGRLESLQFVRRTVRKAPVGGNVVEALGVHAIDLLCHIMGEVERSAIHATGNEIEARVALDFPHGIEAIIDLAWEAEEEVRTVEIMGSIGTIRFDLDIHNQISLVIKEDEVVIPCESSYSPLEAEIRHIIEAIEADKAGLDWTTVPEHGPALRGVRLTERAIRAMPLVRRH